MRKTKTFIMKFKYVLTLATLFMCSSGVCQTKPDNSPPNILCILVDDMGWGDLACQGAEDMRTPNIDRLSKEGLTFTNFYANSTVCSPSRASLLTGLYPDTAGVPGVIRQNAKNNWGYLAKKVPLIPKVLKATGYHTASIGKWHLGLEKENTPNARGFDFFKGFLGDMMDDYWNHRRGGINWMRLNEKEIDPEGHATDLFTDWTVDYLKEREEDKQPFFLYLAYNAPHFPIQPPQNFLEQVLKREPQLSEKRAKNVAFIEHLDYNIGRLLKALQHTGLDENTMVVFTSDNGGALRYAQSNGRLRGGKQDMYEGGIRVPTFVYWKNKVKPGSVTNRFGMLMDLFPTFCEIAGAAVPNDLDGMSLLPTIRGEPQVTDDRSVFWVRREGGHYGGQAYYAARYKNFKIIQNTPHEAIQYFDLEKDPYETAPLEPATTDQIYAKLRTALREHIQQAGAVPWQKADE